MPPLQRIRAVIFDLDNTLVDSRIDYERMKRSTLTELVRLGADPACLDESWTIVRNLERGKGCLSAKGSVTPEEVDARINAVLTENEMATAQCTRVFPGVVQAVRLIRDMGIRTGILTRGSRGYALKVLSDNGLDGAMGPLVCRDDFPLEEAKPHPLAMARAAKMLGARAEECAYAGDHPMDLDCARAAGAVFVGVLTGHTSREAWEGRGCDLIIPSVAELPAMLAGRLLRHN